MQDEPNVRRPPIPVGCEFSVLLLQWILTGIDPLLGGTGWMELQFSQLAEPLGDLNLNPSPPN
jgi:hypothetical protein